MQCCPMIQTSLIMESTYCLSFPVHFIWIKHSFKFQKENRIHSFLYIFMRFFKTRAGRGINTSRKCAHLWTPELPPAWISQRWKVPNPSLDGLIFSDPLCYFTVTDWKLRGSLGRTKIKGELKRKTELNLSICITYPILHLSIRTIQFVFPP